MISSKFELQMDLFILQNYGLDKTRPFFAQYSTQHHVVQIGEHFSISNSWISNLRLIKTTYRIQLKIFYQNLILDLALKLWCLIFQFSNSHKVRKSCIQNYWYGFRLRPSKFNFTFQFWHPFCNEIDIFHWDKQHLVRNFRYLRLKSNKSPNYGK